MYMYTVKFSATCMFVPRRNAALFFIMKVCPTTVTRVQQVNKIFEYVLYMLLQKQRFTVCKVTLERHL